MIHTIIEIIATVIDIVFLVWFVSCYHSVYVWRKPKAFIWVVLLLIYQLFIDTVLPAFDMVALIGAVVFSVGYSVTLQRKIIVKSIFAAFLYLIVIMLTGNFVYSAFSVAIDDIDTVIHGSDSYLRVIYLLVCKLMHFAAYRLLLKIFRKDRTLDWKNGALSFLFTIATALALGFLMKLAVSNPSYEIEILVLVLAALLILLNIILYLMIYQVQSLLKSKYDLILIQDRLSFEKSRVEEVAVIWNNIRQVKHDLKNHFSVLKGHLNEGDIESCQKYVTQLYGTIESMGNLIQSGNFVIDYLINTKLSTLDNVEVLVSGYVGNYADIADVDLACILGNILDNAIEAQEQVISSKRIELLFLRKNSNRIIICKNTIKESVLQNNQRLKSTKEVPELHGMGHQIVETTVKKYNGLIDYYEKDDMFGVQIILPEIIQLPDCI